MPVAGMRLVLFNAQPATRNYQKLLLSHYPNP